ncbi:hypothetical protein D3C81_2328770 [compost metagenome]
MSEARSITARVALNNRDQFLLCVSSKRDQSAAEMLSPLPHRFLIDMWYVRRGHHPGHPASKIEALEIPG